MADCWCTWPPNTETRLEACAKWKIVEKWNKYKRILILANLTHSLMSPIIVPRQYFELYSNPTRLFWGIILWVYADPWSHSSSAFICCNRVNYKIVKFSTYNLLFLAGRTRWPAWRVPDTPCQKRAALWTGRCPGTLSGWVLVLH